MKRARPVVSVVVATNNRPKKLERLLTSLHSQIDSFSELIIIENDYGLAKARNTGWKKAKGKYVAFIDDDAVADPKWTQSIRAFIRSHPEVEAFGGPYESSNQKEIPAWIPAELTRMNISTQKPRPIRIGYEWLTGTNMIFSRELLRELGGFDERLGVVGRKRAYGEETELQVRIANAGYEIWYVPSIRVMHEFASFKQNLWYLLKNQYVNGRNSVYVFRELRVATQKKTAGTAVARLLQTGVPLRRRVYYALAPVIYLLGSLLGRASHEDTKV